MKVNIFKCVKVSEIWKYLMFCIISDSKVAFSSQLTSPLFISSDIPSKPLLKTVGDDKPKSLHVLLATKLAEFFFLHLPITNDYQKEWTSPSTYSLSSLSQGPLEFSS